MEHKYIDLNGNYYVNIDGNYFTQPAIETDVEIPSQLNYLKYKSCIYNNGYKNCNAYIYKNGAYVKVRPYINTTVSAAIADIAIAGDGRV